MKTFLGGLFVGAALALGFSINAHGPAQSATSQFAGAADGNEVRCTTEQLEHNRRLVRAFFAPDRTPLDAYNMMTPDYLQHDEGVKRFGQINGLKDREAFKALDEMLTKSAQRPELMVQPGRRKNELAFKIIATCDYVIALHRTYLPDPQKTGDYYAAFDFELWRIKDGKFAEHWDSQRIPAPVPEFIRVPLRDTQPKSSGAVVPSKNN
jgi:predicted SnoaL-like aldol condensation-catalyzing enzyme